MGSYERRLLRKQINLKLYHMANTEAVENDFLNSSQIITERQQMYMIIAKTLRSKDNARTKGKSMPFMFEKPCLPHVNAARINRLLNSAEEILNNSKEIDMVIKAHSFRTATPYYTNPQLTIDRGNFTNYSKHVGALLHTPRYIQYLKNIPRPGSSKASQKSYQEISAATTGKSVESLKSRESVSLKSKSSIKSINTKSNRSNRTPMPINDVYDGEFANVSRSISPSSKMSLVSNVKSEEYQTENSMKSSEKDYQIPNAETDEKRDERENIPDEKVDKPSSYHESFSSESISVSQKSDILERKRLSSKRSNEVSITDANDKGESTTNETSDEFSSQYDTNSSETVENHSEIISESSIKSSSPIPHIEIEKSVDILSSKGNSEISIKKIAKHEEVIRDETVENHSEIISEISIKSSSPIPHIKIEKSVDILSSKGNSEISIKKIANHEEAIKDVSNETNIISRKRSKEENHNYISAQLETFLKNNEITKDDFHSMERYFDTVHHFRHSRPVYVSDYCQFLTDQKREKFILFAEIFNEYAIESMTEEEAIEIKMLLKNYEEKIKGANNRIENEPKEKDVTLINFNDNVSGVEERDINQQKEKHDDGILYEDGQLKIDKTIGNKNEITEKEIVNEDTNTDYYDNKNERFSNEQILDASKDREPEEPDFSESFQRLFRVSINDIAKDDIETLKNLVNEYQIYMQQAEDNEENVKEGDENEENEDCDFSNSFHSLFRNSISEVKEENISDFQKLVEKLEFSDRNRILSEDSDLEVTKQINLVRRTSQVSGEDIAEGNKNYHQKDATRNDDKTYSNISFDEADRILTESNNSNVDVENEKMPAFRNLFRNSIGKITGEDLDKISKWLETQEKDMNNNSE